MKLIKPRRLIRGRRSKGKAPKSAAALAAANAARAPKAAQELFELSTQDRFVRGLIGMVGVLVVAFLVNILVFSHIYHAVAQQNLRNDFREQLALATAPTAEVDLNDIILKQGAAVAVLDIPAIGVHEIVAEGTDSGTLRGGPGHRRDTVLPGQQGASIIMGRAGAYGAAFARLQELKPGTKFTIITAQGRQIFQTLGLRYAGDLTLPDLQAGESRLVLLTARGAPYVPNGVVRLDAKLVSQVQPAGLRVSSFINVPREDREFGFDFRFVWALVLALQLLIALEVLAIWAFNRIGSRGTYLVFGPLIFFALVLVMDQTTRLLPNLL